MNQKERLAYLHRGRNREAEEKDTKKEKADVKGTGTGKADTGKDVS